MLTAYDILGKPQKMAYKNAIEKGMKNDKKIDVQK